jgi:hypothetical protein
MLSRFLPALASIGLALYSCQVTAASDCNLSQQRPVDVLLGRLAKASQSPKSLSRAERACLVAVTTQILGRYPGGLKDLTSVENATLRAAIAKTLSHNSPAPLEDASLFSQLAADLGLQCSPSIRATPAQELEVETAARCGLVGLPGAPAGLGRVTGLHESGTVEGGYAQVSGDPGAGGWTYGRYQLASEAGGIADFLSVIRCTADKSRCLPDGFRPLGDRLVAVGGVQGARSKSKTFVDEWVRLSLYDRAMQQAQESYQVLATWEPIRAYFKADLGIDLNVMSCGLREAAFSIRTQHSWESARRIFAEAVKVAGKTDSEKIVKAANDWRLARLGAKRTDGGFYSTYGDICLRAQSSTKGVSQEFACSYLDGVRKRWSRESSEFGKLHDSGCQ